MIAYNETSLSYGRFGSANMVVVVERTLALVKPDAVHRSDDILDIAQSSGFVILQVWSK